MFFKPDLILLHAPSVYDFRNRALLFGPISDVVPSTPVFEMYPVGFSSIAECLEHNGIGVRIINLAYRMLKEPKFDAEKMIRKLRPVAFGIDLHWLVHAQGSMEIASICKKYHPDTPVILGGLSSTYYHEELITYPQIDFVFRGDSTEEPLLQLMQQLKQGRMDFTTIPNLTWKDTDGVAHVNAHSYVPTHVNSLTNNYKNLFKMAMKYGDIKSMTAIHDWWSYPIVAMMTVRGCTQNCIICGGSRDGFEFYANRNKPAYRDADQIVEDIRGFLTFSNGPIFIIGDLNQQGIKYGETILTGLKKLNIKNQMVLELFNPATEHFFDMVADALPQFNFEISPESHDEKVRRNSGKFYTNASMEQNIEWALARGCQKFDIFFMIGLSGQTAESALETIDYCEYLIKKFGKRLMPFTAPLAPFLDPGSIAYEKTEKFGYKILYKGFEQHRTAMLNPSWKYFLNYETEWMTREQIVNVTYEAGQRLNEVKYRHGVIDVDTYEKVKEKITLAKTLVQQIDTILLKPDETEREKQLAALELDVRKHSIDTVCEENEIKWPVLKSGFKFINIGKAILFE
ncbi:TIGR04190 family B12-binding domain/radical SAM domain protein [candidate division KSB1 bacterium]|nr:TIGR04190 family B12-binding domain/radical SAM domain protein [candidate division KSB1 bacterium]